MQALFELTMARLLTRMPMLHGTLRASGLGIALLGLVVIAFVSSGNLAALRNAFDWDTHTYVVLIAAQPNARTGSALANFGRPI